MNMDIETLKKKLARKEKIIDNFLAWIVEHDAEFVECAVNAMDLTPEEIDKYELKEYLVEEDYCYELHNTCCLDENDDEDCDDDNYDEEE